MSLGKPVGRSRDTAGCQWLTIGIALGMGCSLVFCLTSYILGFIEIQGLDDAQTTADSGNVVIVTQAPEQITATPQPITPTTAASEEVALAADATESVMDEATDTSASAPTATALGSGAATPTRLPEITGTAAVAAQGTLANAEVGTPVPLGEATITPAIGSGDTPQTDTLLAVASPLLEVPGGTFTMGTTREEGLAAVDACVTRDGGICQEAYIQDSIPAHQVTIDDFLIEQYEVSVDQYVAFLNQLTTDAPGGIRSDLVGCNGRPCALVSPDEANSIIRFNGSEYEVVNPSVNSGRPAVFITWEGADTYCKALGRRLPTEAEWERAARGPANSVYPWGPEWVPENANTSRSTVGGDNTQPTDAYPTGLSAYGVYNMAGNVSEWVFDFYQENYYALPEAAGPNPRGPINGDLRVVRGGGWDNVPFFARSVHRMAIAPQRPHASLGFRCAADASQ